MSGRLVDARTSKAMSMGFDAADLDREDDDDVGGLGVLCSEGLGQGIALFTLAWILTHTHGVGA